MTLRLRRFRLTVLVALVTGWPAAALALDVAIVRPHAPPAITKETIVRLSLELRSVGFATEIVDAPTGSGAEEASPWMAQMAARYRVDAVVAIVGELAPTAVEVWAIDKATGRTVSRNLRFDVDANVERAPEILAIRAMELLRSSLLEIDLTAGFPPTEPVVKPLDARASEPLLTAVPPPSPPERLAIEVGATAVMGPGGVGLTVLPAVQVDWVLRQPLVLTAALAGLGTRATVDTSAGSAQVSQEYVILGAGYRWRANHRVRPFVNLSAGALHTSVEGSADAPNQGHRVSQSSFLMDGGVGAEIRLRDRFFFTVAADAQMAEPYVAIRFVDTVVATRSRPNLRLALAIGAWL